MVGKSNVKGLLISTRERLSAQPQDSDRKRGQQRTDATILKQLAEPSDHLPAISTQWELLQQHRSIIENPQIISGMLDTNTAQTHFSNTIKALDQIFTTLQNPQCAVALHLLHSPVQDFYALGVVTVNLHDTTSRGYHIVSPSKADCLLLRLKEGNEEREIHIEGESIPTVEQLVNFFGNEALYAKPDDLFISE